jgi:virulence-associated protein VagC
MKLANKGNKQAVRLPMEANKRKKQELKVVSSIEDLGVASAAQPVTTRYGRNIKVLNEYK